MLKRQFVPEKAFWASFCREKQPEILLICFYGRLTLNTKKSDICHCDLKFFFRQLMLS